MTPDAARAPSSSPASRAARAGRRRRSVAIAARRARRRGRRPMRCRPRARRASPRTVPRRLARGVAAPLRVTPTGRPGACGCASRVPPELRSTRTRPTAGSTATLTPRRRGRHMLAGGRAARATRPARPRRLAPPRGRRAARSRSTPTCRRRAGSRSPCARAASAIPGVLHARPARARHRVRVDPRLPARRRHPPGQLARDRARRPADEQPVPRRAGPRGHLVIDAGRLMAAPLGDRTPRSLSLHRRQRRRHVGGRPAHRPRSAAAARHAGDP